MLISAFEITYFIALIAKYMVVGGIPYRTNKKKEKI